MDNVDVLLETLQALEKKADDLLFEASCIGKDIRELLGFFRAMPGNVFKPGEKAGQSPSAAELAVEAAADDESAAVGAAEKKEEKPEKKEKGKYWDHAKGKWVDERPVRIGETGLPEPELDIW